MTAQQALRSALRDIVGPAARTHGFRGSAPTWRRRNAHDDWAVVNVQSSPGSLSGRLRCVINLAVAPEPWLRWERDQSGGALPKKISENLGLYRERLHPAGTPEGTDGWWEITESRSAVAVANDMVDQLASSGWPVLDRMLTPGGLLDQVRQGDLGDFKVAHHDVFFARAKALLLMDAGPSRELDASLDYARADVMAEQRDHAEKFDRWVRAQAGRTR